MLLSTIVNTAVLCTQQTLVNTTEMLAKNLQSAKPLQYLISIYPVHSPISQFVLPVSKTCTYQVQTVYCVIYMLHKRAELPGSDHSPTYRHTYRLWKCAL